MHYEKDSKMLLDDPVDDGLLQFEQTPVERRRRLRECCPTNASLRYSSLKVTVKINKSRHPGRATRLRDHCSRPTGYRSAGGALMLEALTAAARPPKGTRFDRITIAGVPVERVRPPRAGTNGTLIYLHGGAYALGSAKGYRGLVAHLAAAAGMTALIPDYSRAPEARYPVALEEMVAGLLPIARGRDRPETHSHRR